ncbi:hypothetical protein NW755_012673 [Fusarium falciforme]|uniref:WW domain-containing protein n=1 Tax=Fusarium falciforme TaxID=195108 RepID=A0A9W8QVH2_9HYPO|nr:hypothetical protein NW755_012673 [Fusarium falciforme]KAJ4247057.1 hypothetical protein NW757_009208 [Fusarium falciforme]
MAGLPEGWDMDYDGQRWFYKYKPTGHIQYHFPKEGDEFPDFVDAGAPAPDLAPEERLESQQQVRRHASTTTASAHAKARREENGWESRMSATARPVSAVWDGDGGGGGDDDNAVFQPENFMYLGPGAYNDVSPLAEEEEEAARRVVAGGIEDKLEKPPGKGVSPIASEKTTPARGAAHAEPVMGEPVAVPPTVPEETHEFVPMIDSREAPMAAPDPVGVIAEMPTEDTGPARIETNPPPVEMADNMVLAPIETAPPPLLAELPEQSSPVEKKNEEPQLAPGSLRNYGGQMQPLRIQKKPTPPVEEVVGGFQAYKPKSVGNTPDISRGPTPMREEPVLERRRTFQPEDHLMMNMKPAQPPYREATSTPAVLAPPQVPPKHPIDDPSIRNAPTPPVMGIDSGSVGPQGPQPPPGNLSYMPSVLKAGRSGNRQDSFSAGPSMLASLDDDKRASLAPGQQGDLAHMPSVLKPARGRAPSQPGQQPQFPPQNINAPPGQGHGYKPPAQGQHPPSMTPAPHVQQQRLQEEPKMGIQRVNTVPDSLPSQRPASMIQGATYQGQQMNVPAGVNQAQQPVRPASVMPNMMGGHPQQAAGRPNPPIPAKQGVIPPYPDQIPATAPPPSGQAAPFGRPPVQNPPYPVDNLPYPDDPPMQRPPLNFPSQGAGAAPGPGHLNRRHSSFSGAEVSPIDSRHGSVSSMYPIQTPSPMEHSRRGSSSVSLNQSVNPNYTPSPVSQSSSSMYGFTPTPPSAPTNQSQQGYFTMQDVESQGQGHAVAAQNMLRKKSLSRGPPDARRSSVGSPLSSPPTTESYGAAQQGLSRSQSLRQTSQGNVVPQSQVVPAPTPPPQGQQFLGRIEEHEEVPSGTVSRSSTMSGSPEKTRRSSMASSVQHSPAGSRRTSLQGDSPRGASPSQPQGQYSPSNQLPQGPMPSQGQFISQGPVQGQGLPGAPYPGQTPMQNPAQLQRKPSKGQAPIQGAPRPQGQPPYPNQMPVQGQVPVGGPMSPQGQMPPQALPGQQGQRPHGQPIPGQTPPPAQTSHHGPGKLLRKLSKTQPSPPQAAPQGQPPYPQQAPGPKLLQRRSSQGPGNPMGHAPPQGQMPPGQMPHPGQAPNGRVQPQIQIPQNQQQWAPGMQPPTPQGFRPGPVPPQGPQSAGPKEGKGGKWFKLFKGGSKSTAPTPTTPIVSSPVTAINNAPPRWGGGEYSTPAVWQPGQPPTASLGPGFQGNMPPQPGQAPQSGQMPPEPVRGPGNAAPGQVPPGQGNMPPQPGHMAAQPSQMPQPSQIPTQPVPGPGRAPPGQGPPGPGQMAPQSGQMPIQPGQMGPKPGQVPTQPSQMGPQRGQAPPGMGQVPPGPSQIAMQPGQRPLGPGQMPPQSDPKPLLPGEMAPQPGRIPSGHMSPPNPQAPPAGAARISPSPSAGHIPANGPSQIAPLSSPSKAGPSNAHQNLPSQIPPPGQNSVSRPPQPMPVPQTRTPEPHQSKNIPAPLRPDTLRASPEPPLASSPGLSDAGLSSMSRVSSHQKRDSLSDAGSITTIEVSEAKPQPVLRPSIVQVHRRSTDMFRKSEEIQRNMEALANADAAPRGSSDTSRFEQPLTIQKAPSPAPNVQPQQPISRPGSATPRDALERSLSPAPLFSKSGSPKPAQNGPSSRQENNMEPTPLFSKPNPPVSAVSGLPSQQMKPAPIVQQQPPPKPAPPPADDKWAKKPVVDYSGGDWGDDDEWDY